MSNSSINNISSIKHGENEHETDESERNNENSIENKKTEETVFENNVEIIVKHSDDSWIKVDNVDAPTIVLKDIVINIEDKKVPKKSNKRSKWFKNFLRRDLKKPQNLGKSNNLNHRKKTNMCVLFSFGSCGDDDDDDDDYDDEILDYDPDPRGTYVIVVLSIVGAMLFLTAVFLLIVYNVPTFFKYFYKPSFFLYISSFGGLLFIYYSMLCLDCGRLVPCGYILLILTVIFASFVSAIVTCQYQAEVVIHGFLAATGVVLTCTGLACTEFDFTSFWLYLIVVSTGFTVVAMSVMMGALITGVHIRPLHIMMLCISTLLHSVAFIMELQMILGEKSIEVSYDDYAMGAFMLYTSVLDIFMKIAQLTGLIHQ